jgi:hypothetical protein
MSELKATIIATLLMAIVFSLYLYLALYLFPGKNMAPVLPYRIVEQCLEEKTEKKWGYHFGPRPFRIFDYPGRWHWGYYEETKCVKYRRDTIWTKTK